MTSTQLKSLSPAPGAQELCAQVESTSNQCKMLKMPPEDKSHNPGEFV